MEFEKLLQFAEIVNYVCSESFQGVNGETNGKTKKHDKILDNFKTWTEAGCLDKEDGWLCRYRINEKGINEIIKITIIYIRALKKIIKKIPSEQLTRLKVEFEDFLEYREVILSLLEYQNKQKNSSETLECGNQS